MSKINEIRIFGNEHARKSTNAYRYQVQAV